VTAPERRDPVLVLLDVDGVVLPLDCPDSPQVEGVRFAQVGGPFGGWLPHCWYCPEVVERLKQWASDGLVELRWLTSWKHEANEMLGPTLGLGPFEYAIEGDGEWPKAGHVAHVLETTDRRVVWFDDEIGARVAGGECPDFEGQYGHRVRTVTPARNVGLLPAHLDALEGWLTGP
jgi:hypothetical protein